MTPTAAERNQDNKGSWAGVVKWVVLGIVGMTFLFLFRSELSRLLDRVTGVKISSTGVELKTVETPLGRTEVSSVPLKLSGALAEGIHGTDFVSQRFNFRISWPDAVNWTANESAGSILLQQLGAPATVKIPIVITRNERVEGFLPNVNVLVEQVGNVSIRQYMDLSIQGMQQRGQIILSENVDEETQGGLLVFFNTSYGSKLYQFQRIAIAFGRAYVVTASQLPPDNVLSQQLREELRSILNSFRLIS